jgi:hypothetical protein
MIDSNLLILGTISKKNIMPKPRKKIPATTNSQTLLAIKPKPSAEPIADLVTEPEPTLEPVEQALPKPIKKLPNVKKPVVEAQVQVSGTEQQQPEKPQEQQDEQERSSSLFQAVGIISGTIRFNEYGKTLITLGDKEYPLYYVPSKNKRKAYEGLLKEMANTGNYNQRLIVYPRITHYPKKEQMHQVGFQVVGFDKGCLNEGIAAELEDFQFKLCGLWQFIPVCQTPCITVLRNFTPERLDYIKREETSTLSKVKFMKASHVPVLWRDAPVRPFRFNPKTPKEQQGHSCFVEIKVRFLPSRDVFGFDSLLAPPADKPPRFFKARKEDKAEAIKALKQLKAQK